jgi:hypothetical protein
MECIVYMVRIRNGTQGSCKCTFSYIAIQLSASMTMQLELILEETSRYS